MKRDFGGWDQNEEADPVKGAKIQVLCAGVGDGTNVGQQLSGHRQLDRPDLTPLYEKVCRGGHRVRGDFSPTASRAFQHAFLTWTGVFETGGLLGARHIFTTMPVCVCGTISGRSRRLAGVRSSVIQQRVHVSI